MSLWDEIKKCSDINQFVAEGERLVSYSELIRESEKLAVFLSGYKCCAIKCRGEINTAIGLMACFAAKITAVPMPGRYGEKYCDRIRKKISPDIIVSDETGVIEIQASEESTYVAPHRHPALIMCTSGTTGEPKGVMLSENNILCNLQDMLSYFKLDSNDSILITRPLFHCAVLVGEFLVGILSGAKVFFYSEAFNPQKILKEIENKNITTFCGTPTTIEKLAYFSNRFNTSSLKQISISGECLDSVSAKRITDGFCAAKIFHVYGLTEASPRVCYLPHNMFGMYSDYVGKPFNSIQTRIVDEQYKEVRPDEKGTLWIKGKNVMIGYYGDSKKTNKVLRNGWLCTGDIASKNEEGYIRIWGREDDLIIKAGMNIYPQEIEMELKKDSRVSDIVAYGYKEENGYMQIGIIVSGVFSSEMEVKTMCAALLPSFEIPNKIEIVTSVNENSFGKKKRRITSVSND